jgi:hypothetical protein
MTLPIPGHDAAPDFNFIALAAEWMRDQADVLLSFVWLGYDRMREDMPVVDGRDLERSITQLLEPRIDAAMSGDEPFYIQHSPFEQETMAQPPAQPPAYDLAFVLRADERIMWPLEAKVLETPRRLSEYERDIQEEFLKCRYAPFSGAAAMLGYLLTGSPVEALDAIAVRLNCDLKLVPAFQDRPHRISSHHRTVPEGKSYVRNFNCHHLILEYSGLTRAKS